MVKESFEEPEQQRKLFIGGLDYRTTDEGLKAHFEQFGDIVDVVVMTDPKTKRSRGFGFVAFSCSYMVDEAQKARPHKIDGRVVDTKRAVPRDGPEKPQSTSGGKTTKLFISGFGLKDDVEEEDLIEAFSEFGKVSNVSIPVDKDNGKKRGFGYIEFEDTSSVEKACAQRKVIVRGRNVEVKKAVGRDQLPGGGGSGGGGGGYSSGGYGGDSSYGSGGSSRGGARGGRGGGSSGAPPSWTNSFPAWGPGASNPWTAGGGYGGPGGYPAPWQGPPVSQGWGTGANQGWGAGAAAYGMGGPANPWNGSAAGSNFGSYSQSYGGGPMRGAGYGGAASRTTPYSAGSAAAVGGYGSGYTSTGMGAAAPRSRY